MLAIKPPEAQNEAAPCSLPGGGGEQGGWEGTLNNFRPSVLTTLGMGNLVCCLLCVSLGVFTFSFKWKSNGGEKGGKAGEGGLFRSETHKISG